MRITTWTEDSVICARHLVGRVDEGPVAGRERLAAAEFRTFDPHSETNPVDAEHCACCFR